MFFGKPKKFYLDATERVIWTALQVASAGAIVAWAGWDMKWTAPIATGIALLKVFFIAPVVGNPDTATTLPQDPEANPYAKGGSSVDGGLL